MSHVMVWVWQTSGEEEAKDECSDEAVLGVKGVTASAMGAGGESPRGTFGIEGVVSRYWKRGARWNDTFTGTWTSVDPITALNDPSRATPYAYAGDNPLNAIDPSGRFSLGLPDVLGAVGAAIGTGLAVAAVGAGCVAAAPVCVGLGAVAGASGGVIGGGLGAYGGGGDTDQVGNVKFLG